jgi:hypothetical protein
MKKATRLLILTAFVFSLLFTAQAYAGGPVPGHHPSLLDKDRFGTDPFGAQNTDPFHSDNRTIDGFRQSDYNPMRLADPIENSGFDRNRNDLYNRSVLRGGDLHQRSGRPDWNPAANGGGTAPIDGGLSLLLAAGIGLGLKKARARKQTV